LFLNSLGNVGTVGLVKILACLLALIPLNPRILGVVEACQSILYYLKALAALANTYYLTGLNAIRRDTYHLSVNYNVLVVNELTSSTTSGSNTQTVNDVIKTALEVLKEDLTSDATSACCLLEHIAELFLQHTIGVLSLLLLSKHDAILGSLATTVVSMLARREVTLSLYLWISQDSLAEATVNP
jgi:hypothetical protein